MDMATQASPGEKLKDRGSYHEMRPKQKAIIRAYAENPDKGAKALSEIASGFLDGDDTVSRSYVHTILDRYPHIAEQQLEIQENKRQEGTERTTGDPFDNLEETLGDTSKAYQTIQERPYKGESNNKGDSTENEENTLQANLSRSDVESLLSGEVPEELRRELVIQIVDRAFQ